MATHSSVLAWRIPWTEGTGGLKSTGSQRDMTEATNRALVLVQAERSCHNALSLGETGSHRRGDTGRGKRRESGAAKGMRKLRKPLSGG